MSTTRRHRPQGVNLLVCQSVTAAMIKVGVEALNTEIIRFALGNPVHGLKLLDEYIVSDVDQLPPEGCRTFARAG